MATKLRRRRVQDLKQVLDATFKDMTCTHLVFSLALTLRLDCPFIRFALVLHQATRPIARCTLSE